MAKHASSAQSFADRLRLARRWRGLSQRALSSQVGVSPSAAAQWEKHDGTMPSVQHLAQIAVATRVGFEWLATGRGEASAGDVRAPAATLSDFALDHEEERLLADWRRLSRKARSAIALVIEQLLRGR